MNASVDAAADVPADDAPAAAAPAPPELVPNDVEVMEEAEAAVTPTGNATPTSAAVASVAADVADTANDNDDTNNNDKNDAEAVVVLQRNKNTKWPESLPHQKSHFFLSVVCGNSRCHWALHDPKEGPAFSATLWWKTTAPKPAPTTSSHRTTAATANTKNSALSIQDFFTKFIPEKACRLILANENTKNAPPSNHSHKPALRSVVQELLPLFPVQDVPIITIYVISTNITALTNMQHLLCKLPARLICLHGSDFFNPKTCMPIGYETGMGVDRLAALSAAEQLYGNPTLVIDGGTATTLTATAIREDDNDNDPQGAIASAVSDDATAAADETNNKSSSSDAVWNTVKVRGGGIGPGVSAKFMAMYTRTSALPHIRYHELRDYIKQCKHQQQSISVLDAKGTTEAMMNYVLRETACHLQSVIATWAKEAMSSPTFQKRQQAKLATLEQDEKKNDHDDDDGRPIGDAGYTVNHDLTVVVTGGDADIILDLLDPNHDNNNNNDDDDGAATAGADTDTGAVSILHPDTVLPELPCKVKFQQSKQILHQAISQLLWMHHVRNKNVPKRNIHDMLVGQRVVIVQKRPKKMLLRGTVLSCRPELETNDDDDDNADNNNDDDQENEDEEDVYQIICDDGNRAEIDAEELYDALLLYNKEGEDQGHYNNSGNASGERATHAVLDDDLEEMRDAKRQAAKEACKALEQCVPALVARMAKLEAAKQAKHGNNNSSGSKRVFAADDDDRQASASESSSSKRARNSSPLEEEGQEDQAAAAAAAPVVLPPTHASLKERPKSYVGRRVAKFFDDECYFGEIEHFDKKAKLWHVLYDDGDDEDYDSDDMIEHFKLYEIKKEDDTRDN